MHWTVFYLGLCLAGGEVGLLIRERAERHLYTPGVAYFTGFVLWPVMVVIAAVCIAVWLRAVAKSVTANVRRKR